MGAGAERAEPYLGSAKGRDREWLRYNESYCPRMRNLKHTYE
jgi:hypothetical protein